MLSRRHAEYLIELVEEDLELDQKTPIFTTQEREIAVSTKRRLEGVVAQIERKNAFRTKEKKS